jgi:hypothetical protein
MRVTVGMRVRPTLVLKGAANVFSTNVCQKAAALIGRLVVLSVARDADRVAPRSAGRCVVVFACNV